MVGNKKPQGSHKMSEEKSCAMHSRQINMMEEKLSLFEKKLFVVEDQQKNLNYEIRELRTDIRTVRDGNAKIADQLVVITNLIENGKGAWWLLTKIALWASALGTVAAGVYHTIVK
jgi:septal ring factor EnvC (AmiA/AmiB activator)